MLVKFILNKLRNRQLDQLISRIVTKIHVNLKPQNLNVEDEKQIIREAFSLDMISSLEENILEKVMNRIIK